MNPSSRILTTCAACLFLVCTLCAPTGAEETAWTSTKEPCCFENPRFTGTCQVTPGEDENCGGILSYLNNPNSVGKNYCGNTKVRGGWSQAQCKSSVDTGVCGGSATSQAQE